MAATSQGSFDGGYRLLLQAQYDRVVQSVAIENLLVVKLDVTTLPTLMCGHSCCRSFRRIDVLAHAVTSRRILR